MKVYTPEGSEEEKDSVDARECVEHCGYSYEPIEPVTGSTKTIRGKNAKTTDSSAAATDDASTAAVVEGDATDGAASPSTSG